MTEKATTAATGEASTFPVSLPGSEVGGSVIVAAVTLVGAIMYFRRKVSRDGTEIIKDRADGKLTQSLIDVAESSRIEAKEAWAEFNKLNAEVGQLRAENTYLKREVDRLMGELTKAQEKIDKVRNDLWKLRNGKEPGHDDSDHTPLN